LSSICHNNSFFLFKYHSPNCFGWLAELAYESAGFKVPYFDTTVRAPRYNAGLVKLEGRDTIVVCSKAVDRRESFEGPDTDGAVRATSAKDGMTKL